MMWWQSVLLISLGASLGACVRWGLGLWLNSLFTSLSFGVLVANYLGSFIIGITIACCWFFPLFGSWWRLFLITGFLGSLTTFSAFSAEVIENLFQGSLFNALMILLFHVLGSLLCTVLGIIAVRYWIS
ncbi:chromosome condensation protein CrcB [[Haemophilus] felis]|uniref:Fluoride-specific ion channel FluC n=1 Tax=[Haemophilus] felis TaxID=123822 RepID=A0A1T0AU27_9PAST|nr:chromosome condensation protein CrcB [[Haemophilus] felis]NBI41359.1 chromosome condensation protein CrcB [[Haemophilus] felis]OOS00199.1 fluoride ion transporter CrcB [[Haemophilus] felis]